MSRVYDSSKINIYVPLIDFWFEGYAKDMIYSITYDRPLMEIVTTQKGNMFGNRHTSNRGTITLNILDNSEVLDEIMVLVDFYKYITVGFPLIISNTNDGREFDSYMFDGCIIEQYPERKSGSEIGITEVKIRFARQFPMAMVAGMDELGGI